MDGKQVVQRDKMQADVEGKLDMNFNLPENRTGNNLSLVVTDPKDANHKISIPIAANRPENIDLQFMPEGGNLIAGVPTRIGFKAIAEDGNGAEVSGKIYNGKNEEVASFASSHKGMGSFELKAMDISGYTARVMLNGIPKNFPLPSVKNIGSALRITNSVSSDSIKATITVSTNLATTSSAIYHLVGQAGGKVYYDEEIPVNDNTFITKAVAKDLFPTGVVRFTLMNPGRQPMNERVTFVDHYDNLDISIKAAKESYKIRDSVSVAIEVRDSEGRPVEGSFSLAVTDDSQVRNDSLSTNILTQMLLSSGLKGTIEAPGHYLQNTAQAAADLDHLLLTQGWIGYDWKEVFNPPVIPVHPAEQEFVISGKVTNAGNKVVSNTSIQIASLEPASAKTGVTRDDGTFAFGGLPVAENLQFFLQARNKNNKKFNVGVGVDQFKPTEFKPESRSLAPWYVNSDTTLLRQSVTKAVQQERLMVSGTNLLQEVSITGKKIVRDSKNLNGAGEADQILDEKDISKAPKKLLLDLMNEQVKGFGVGVWPSKNVIPTGIQVAGISAKTDIPMLSTGRGDGEHGKGGERGTVALVFNPVMSYLIFDKEMHLVIDGIDVESMYQPTPGEPLPTTNVQLRFQKDIDPAGDYILMRNGASPTDRQYFIRQFLERITAEDVKGIEVMTNPVYNNRYKSKYAWKILSSLSMTTDFAYVEVTTYSGNGAFVSTPVGTYLHKPISFVNTTAFYKPKYIPFHYPLGAGYCYR